MTVGAGSSSVLVGLVTGAGDGVDHRPDWQPNSPTIRAVKNNRVNSFGKIEIPPNLDKPEPKRKDSTN